MVFDPVMNEQGEGREPGITNHLMNKKTTNIVNRLRLKNKLSVMSGSNAIKYPELICQRCINAYSDENII
jgi:hypothetical protein